jgi:hypothetical protein
MLFSLPSLLRIVAAPVFDELARLTFERRGGEASACSEQRLVSRATRFFLKVCQKE